MSSQTLSREPSFDVLSEKVAVHSSSDMEESATVYKVTDLEADAANYSVLIIIGRGCFSAATISLGKHELSDTLVAIKRQPLDDCPIELSLLQYELSMHRNLRHPYLLPSLCSFVHDRQLCTLFPLMDFGSCRDLLHAHFTEGLPELAIAHIVHDVLQGLIYMHQRGLVHRSVRASHVLISAAGQVALSGFRHVLSMMSHGQHKRSVYDFPPHYQSSLNWASPELLSQNLAGYNTKSDIYSVGILACELANGVVPFADMPATQMLLEKVDGTTPRLLDSLTVPELQLIETTDADSAELPYQRTFSQHFHMVVELCLQTEPSLRPTAAALLQHAFFRQRRASESLPELLRPVTPLTAMDLSAVHSEQLAVTNDVDGVVTGMDSMTVTDDWLF